MRFAWREVCDITIAPGCKKMGPAYARGCLPMWRATRSSKARWEKSSSALALAPTKTASCLMAPFSEFADARSLKVSIPNSLAVIAEVAQPGDLLFSINPWVQKFPYHVMIFWVVRNWVATRRPTGVVYHTGSSPTDEGNCEERLSSRFSISTLTNVGGRWKVIPNFLGFYRLKILE